LDFVEAGKKQKNKQNTKGKVSGRAKRKEKRNAAGLSCRLLSVAHPADIKRHAEN
jgi:hypothetical protein